MSINLPETMTAEVWAAEFAAYLNTAPAEDVDLYAWFYGALSYAFDEGYNDGINASDAEVAYEEGYEAGQTDARNKVFK